MSVIQGLYRTVRTEISRNPAGYGRHLETHGSSTALSTTARCRMDMDWRSRKPARHAIRVKRSLKARRPAAERAVNEAAGMPHFDVDVLRRSQHRLVLAEFWAPWCTAGQRLHPALERVAARHYGRVSLVSINIEMHAQVLGPQHVHGLPMVKAYFKGIAIGE